MTTIIYKDHAITKKCGFYWAIGLMFTSIGKAKKAIDEIEEQYLLINKNQIMNKKCTNCKFAGHNNRKKAIADDHCLLPNNLPDIRLFKYTTNSKNFTHCDKWELNKK